MWMGEHQDRKVAVKVLRVCLTSKFDKITGVGCLYSPLTIHTDELTDDVEVLQGSCYVGYPSPSKRVAAVGSGDE